MYNFSGLTLSAIYDIRAGSIIAAARPPGIKHPPIANAPNKTMLFDDKIKTMNVIGVRMKPSIIVFFLLYLSAITPPGSNPNPNINVFMVIKTPMKKGAKPILSRYSGITTVP